MGHQTTQLRLILLFDKRGVEPQHLAIGGCSGYVTRYPKLGKQCQGSEKWMITANAQQRTL
jgi:hypothetical protein